MARRLILLVCLCLSETTLADQRIISREQNARQLQPLPEEPFPPPPEGRIPEEEDLLKSYDQLKSLYNNLKQKLERKIKKQEETRPRMFGASNVAVDPLFLDLDNIDSFNDISSDDFTSTTIPSSILPTTSMSSLPPTTTFSPTTIRTTTSGPMVIGHDALGRQILKFVSQWEEEFSSTERPSTLSFLPSSQRPKVIVPDFSFRDPLVTGPLPPVPIFVPTTSTTPISNSLEDLTAEEPLIMAPFPPKEGQTTAAPRRDFDFPTTSFFSRAPFFESTSTASPRNFPINRGELEKKGFSSLSRQALVEMKSSEDFVEIPTIPSPFWTSPFDSTTSSPKREEAAIPFPREVIETSSYRPVRVFPKMESTTSSPPSTPTFERPLFPQKVEPPLPTLFEEEPKIKDILEERNFPRSSASPPGFDSALFARNLETGTPGTSPSPLGSVENILGIRETLQERNFPRSEPPEERTFPSFITEIRKEEKFLPKFEGGENFSGFTTEKPTEATTEDGVEEIWWTPRPSFLGMSSILSAPPPKPPPLRPPLLWHPRWKLTTPSSLATPQFIHPEVEERVKKVAEQSVINEIELVAGSMNMSELVKELRGEQPLPPVINSKIAEELLETKKRTLKQLEILDHLANRKNDLQQLIEKQKAMLNEMKVGRRIVTGQAQVRARSSNKQLFEENVVHMPTSRIPPPPMSIPATPREATWSRKRSESARKRRLRNRKSKKSARPHRTLVDESVPSVEELTEMLEREMRLTQKRALADELRQLCSQTICDFEQGDFCHFETSYDEVTRRMKNKREKRETENSPIYAIRSWSNWIGTFSSNSTRVDRAPHFKPRNSRFAGVFLEPQQTASLSLSITYASPFTIHFKGWEASLGVRLRVCCDDYCPFSTELKRTRKKWKNFRAECPADTKQLVFECENVGNRKGVCAVDDVFVAEEGCPNLDDINPLTQ